MKLCPANCTVSEWSRFGGCSVSCGSGMQTRKREVLTKSKSKISLELHDADVDVGDNVDVCLQILTETKLCHSFHCPVDCVLNSWGQWGKCSVTCNAGLRQRTRIANVTTAFGGDMCGASAQYAVCHQKPCGVDCGITEWGRWEGCSKTCGSGVKTRLRTIFRQPSGGGLPCPSIQASKSCATIPCSVDCALSTWGSWDKCSSSCSSDAYRSRTRKVVRYSSSVGKPCPALVDSAKCNQHRCESATEWSGNLKVGSWHHTGGEAAASETASGENRIHE